MEMRIWLKFGDQLKGEYLKYVCQFIEQHKLAGGNLRFVFDKDQGHALTLKYGEVKGEGIRIPEAGHIFDHFGSSFPSLYANRYNWQGMKLYSVEKGTLPDADFFGENGFGFDVFETLFYHISRYEEYFPDKSFIGHEGILPENAHFLVRHKLEKWPVVDHLVYAFLSCLGAGAGRVKTTFHLSHDIDKIRKYNSLADGVKAFGWPIVFRKDLQWAFRSLARYFRVRAGRATDPYENYNYLFRTSDAWQSRVVYFMAGGSTRYDLFDRHYAIQLPRIAQMALERGYRIGLHPSYQSAQQQELIQVEREKLEQITGEKVILSRQHFLRFIPGITGKHLEKSGIQQDSSMGYTRRIGFRCGTGFAYRPYDFENKRACSYLEQPLVVMDSALIHEVGDRMEAFESSLKEFVDQHRELTSICFNFHNSTFDDTLFHRKSLKGIYERLEKRL